MMIHETLFYIFYPWFGSRGCLIKMRIHFLDFGLFFDVSAFRPVVIHGVLGVGGGQRAVCTALLRLSASSGTLLTFI